MARSFGHFCFFLTKVDLYFIGSNYYFEVLLKNFIVAWQCKVGVEIQPNSLSVVCCR